MMTVRDVIHALELMPETHLVKMETLGGIARDVSGLAEDPFTGSVVLTR
jgi:hypothetical protein